MSSYDQPGFRPPTVWAPGGFDAHGDAMTALGSVLPPMPDTSAPLSDRIEQGTLGSSAVITPVGGSLVNADIVPVGPLDTLVPAEAATYGATPDPLTGIGSELGLTGAGSGHTTSHHPNSQAQRP